MLKSPTKTIFIFLRVLLLFFLCLIPTTGYCESADEKALQELNDFIFSPSARQEFAATNKKAQAAEADFSRFPPYAQQEMNEIIMMIMRELGENAAKFETIQHTQGSEAAFNAFSPAVQKRIQALARKLSADKSWRAHK